MAVLKRTVSSALCVRVRFATSRRATRRASACARDSPVTYVMLPEGRRSRAKHSVTPGGRRRRMSLVNYCVEVSYRTQDGTLDFIEGAVHYTTLE